MFYRWKCLAVKFIKIDHYDYFRILRRAVDSKSLHVAIFYCTRQLFRLESSQNFENFVFALRSNIITGFREKIAFLMIKIDPKCE